jgi:GST-like protein
VYGSFTVSDHPELFSAEADVQWDMVARSQTHRENLWRMVEAAAGQGPWFLGARFSALDLYIAVMTRWNPRRDWFKADCPRLHAIALAVDAMPELAAVWKRNFPG